MHGLGDPATIVPETMSVGWEGLRVSATTDAPFKLKPLQKFQCNKRRMALLGPLQVGAD